MTVTTAVLDRARARPGDNAVVTDLGSVSVAEFAARIASHIDELRVRRVTALEIVPVLHADPVEALALALAVDRLDAVALVSDVRWSDSRASGVLASLGIPGRRAQQPGWAAFSSGSTGDPRVIVRGRDSWITSFPYVSAILGIRTSDTVLVPVSLVSSLSLFAAMHALWSGCALALPSDGSDAALAAVIPGSTVLHATPTALMRVLDSLDRGVPHSIRVAMVGGAPLSDDERARAVGHGIRVVSYYGAAELSFVAVDIDGTGLRRFPGVEWRITPIPGTAVGELAVRSGYLADGYLGSGGPFVESDGWASVGDVVTLPGSGGLELETIELRGRGDGAILTAGATVVPSDVEEVVRTLPGIRDAIVFGVPHSRLGAIVCVVVETSEAAGSAEYRAWRAECRERLTIAQNPRRWFASDRFERTLGDKTARARMIAAALSGAAGVRRLG